MQLAAIAMNGRGFISCGTAAGKAGKLRGGKQGQQAAASTSGLATAACAVCLLHVHGPGLGWPRPDQASLLLVLTAPGLTQCATRAHTLSFLVLSASKIAGSGLPKVMMAIATPVCMQHQQQACAATPNGDGQAQPGWRGLRTPGCCRGDATHVLGTHSPMAGTTWVSRISWGVMLAAACAAGPLV